MVNDLGVDPNEWFENPLDKMPIAKDSPSWEDTAPSEYEPPDVPAELMEVPTSAENPKPEPKKEEKTMHQKMYEIATARYNPFSVGGSENCDSDISCTLGGGSETIQK